MRRECPFCAEYVSATATVCPHCETEIGNRSMAAASPGRSRSEDSTDAPPRRKSKAVWIIVPLVLVCMMCLCGPIGMALLMPAVQQARTAARETQARNNMKQIGLAMHNFHDTNLHLPPMKNTEDREASEEVVQSWMTDLLPFCDQAALYSTIDRKLPYDDPGNAHVFGSHISTFESPLIVEKSVGLFGPAHFALNVNLWNIDDPIKFRDVTDGLSNTLMVGSIASGDTAAAWGDPDNLRDVADGLNRDPYGFGSSLPGATQFLMMDGRVTIISNSIDPAVLTGLGTIDGGEAVGTDMDW